MLGCEDIMKALVYYGPGEKSWIDAPDPQIQNPTDVIVRIDTTTICGTDLHILKGDVPAVTSGRILGHEGVGVIIEVGSSVTKLAVGDNVIISCIKSCGHCSFCQQGIFAHCLGHEGAPGIGWVFGHLIDGTQAEYVRVPYAETSVYKVPEGVTNQQGVLLSDILPTGFEIGVQYGQVKPGDVVAVIGAGPVGLAVMATAGLYGAARIVAVDLDANRVEQAKKFGATDGVNSGDADWRDQIMALTDGWGVDVAVEAVGLPQTFQMATEIVRPGGRVANVGVHGTVGRAPTAESLDSQHHDLDGAGQQQHHASAAQAGGQRQTGCRQFRNPSLQAARHDGRVRHVHPGRRDQGTEGHHRP
jgi:alcohol dehydrogenase